MIDIDNTMTRDETPSRRGATDRGAGGRTGRARGTTPSRPKNYLIRTRASCSTPRRRRARPRRNGSRSEERERQAAVEKEAAAGRNAAADEWRPSDVKRAPGGLREEDFPALPGGPAPKPAVAIRPPPAPARAPRITGPRFRGKVVGNWTNSGPKGRPDPARRRRREPAEGRFVIRSTRQTSLQLKAGDRVEYGHAAQKTTQGRTVARNVTKVDAGALRRAPVRNAGAKVEDAGVPLAQRVTRPRDDGLQRALAASRADFDAEEQKRLAEREDEELAKALMLSAAAASEDDRRRREQEAAEASRRMAEMAAAKHRGRRRRRPRPRQARPTPRRIAGCGGRRRGHRLPRRHLTSREAERRAAAARAQLAQIERARRAAAEELRASQNIVEDARRRAARDQQRTAFQPQSPPRSFGAGTGVATEDAGHAGHGAQDYSTLGTRPAFDSKQRDFVAFLASIGLQHYAQKLREEQIDCIADLKILNGEDLEACGIPPRDAATMMAGLADLHPGVA